uniref:Late embryogenesis abundant protein LEA-2 subgroup domain-containing protein n=1 Tax=Leersia perrieri TaxID=77586 RepID=A0A0D9WU11_9ORYZ
MADRHPPPHTSTADDDVVAGGNGGSSSSTNWQESTPWRHPKIRAEKDHHRSSGVAWAVVILCTLLAIGVIVAGATVFAVYLIYKPRMPYLLVADARMVSLQYDQAGTISYLRVLVDVVARNTNSRADASFTRVDLALRFHGADVARLRAAPFAVARASAAPLLYDVVSGGQPLDAGAMRAMDASLKSGVVPLDLVGRARTRWKVGIFASLKFWTRISCRLHFFFPGNGTVMAADRNSCTSKSP